MELDAIITGFSALSVLTRQMVIGELDRALQDTSIEYHRQTTRELQCKLANEVGALSSLLSLVKRADEEFKEITGEDNRGVHQRSTAFRTSSERQGE